MHAFTYHCPTEIIFGKDAQLKTADYIRKYGGSRVLLVYGSGSIERSGLLGQLCQILTENHVTYELFGGAKANPSLEHAREGVALARKFGADFILGAGGGSVLDTAKAIAIGAANVPTDIWQFWIREKTPQKALPVGAILTISAAGSESSDSAVLTNLAEGVKRGLNTELNRPRFAIMNPELTLTLPPYQVACGVTDIMMHTMDRYFNPLDNELTDAIAEALLRTVIANGRIAVQNPHDYDSMSELMWAGSLSHNGLTGLGGNKDFAVHQIGHELSAMFDTAHGASLATVWGSWANYVCDAKISRFARFAKNVWGVTISDETEAAMEGIKKTVGFFRSIGMPTSFEDNKDIGVQDDVTLHDLAYRCSYHRSRTIGSFKVLGEEDICQIYKNANHAAKF
ncbi:MAG TPA: NADH-dependent alcohol dehydrogenase [Lachnoclostridium sp.]|nr:NADH-dependent alcohol dehydrogenase [Lachnoclostridium sp.]